MITLNVTFAVIRWRINKLVLIIPDLSFMFLAAFQLYELFFSFISNSLMGSCISVHYYFRSSHAVTFQVSKNQD